VGFIIAGVWVILSFAIPLAATCLVGSWSADMLDCAYRFRHSISASSGIGLLFQTSPRMALIGFLVESLRQMGRLGMVGVDFQRGEQ
jgi:hypothetical protein